LKFCCVLFGAACVLAIRKHGVPPCAAFSRATLRHPAPPCATLRHPAPPCATLRRVQPCHPAPPCAAFSRAGLADNRHYRKSRAILAVNCICGTMPRLHLRHDAVIAFAARCHVCICGTMPCLHLRHDVKLRWIESETTKGGSMQMRRDPRRIMSKMQRAAFIPLALYGLLDTCRKRKILWQKPPPPKFFEPTRGFRKQKKGA